MVLALACLTLAVGPAKTQTVVIQGQNPATPWGQKIFFGVTGHDFGTVPYGAQLKHRFKIKNIYAVPLDITSIRPSCACLSSKPGKDDVPVTLGPKEERYIDIVVDARRFKGPKTVSLNVTFGPQFVSTATLVITANARTDVVFNPGEVDFGSVSQGRAITQVIDVEYAGALDWRILEIVKSADAPFSVEPRELYRKGSGFIRQTITVGYRIQVTLKETAPAGPFHQELILKTNDPSSPVLPVEVEGNVQAALSVAPSVVSLGNVKVGNTKTQKVSIRGNRPFRILDIEGGGDGVTAQLPAGAAQAHVLTLTCRPDQVGEWRKQLTIHTDLDGGTTATVTVEGTVQP
jgi:hypothetical protein